MDLGLQLNSDRNDATETQYQLTVMMKEEDDIVEETYGNIIAFELDEEQLQYRTGSDFAESKVTPTHTETLQTIAEIEVKIEDDEHEDDLLESKSFQIPLANKHTHTHKS